MDTLPTKLHTIHFVGIKGVAMTALAIYCKEKGMDVTGSDVADDFPTKEPLTRVGIIPLEGFSQDHISSQNKPDLVIYTGAHGGADNVEVQTARRLGVPVMPHGKALGQFMEGYSQISVAGSHGKTTTSAMIATILTLSGRDPSYAIGCGQIRPIGLPGHYGKGKEFVAEADEYVTDPGHDTLPRFLWQHPYILVVTNIDFDHPDVYADLEKVQEAFQKLQAQMGSQAVTIINKDDVPSSVLSHTSSHETISFGCSPESDLHSTSLRFDEGKTCFQLSLRGTPVGEDFILRVPGKHNVTNAAAAALACHSLGVPWGAIRDGLYAFEGTKRRFEYIGNFRDMPVYDDYAHHPHEIEATLDGIRLWYPNHRLIVIFQPHTYSRTKALLPLFARCFDKATTVCIADIYASARECDNGGITSANLVEEIAKGKKDVWYIRDSSGAIQFLEKHGHSGDIVVLMGAGDIYDWGKTLIHN